MMAVVVSSTAMDIPAGSDNKQKNRAPYGAPFCIKCRASRVRSFDFALAGFAQDDTGVARISLERSAVYY